MEIKKTDRADLESRRLEWFLLALVVVMASCYVALNYTTTPGTDTAQMAPADDMTDLDMLPVLDRSDMIAATSAPAPAQPTAKKVNVVDQVHDQLTKISTINDLRTSSADGEGGAEGGAQTDDSADDESKAQSPVAVDANDNVLNLRVVEQLPEFPGGMVELMKWLTKNLRYPYYAQKQKLQGRVVVSFIINADGSVVNAKVAKSVAPLLDNEALRVVRLMPKWKPGMQKGHPCRTMFAIPVEFRL